MKVYLASPFFNKAESSFKQKIKARLEALGITVLDPQTHNLDHGWEMTNTEWGELTFQGDIRHINEADAVVALDWGMYSDTGTAWEIGFAYGLQKPILVIVPKEVLPKTHSLMVKNGCSNFITEERFFLIDNSVDFEEIINSGLYSADGVVVS